MPILFFFLFREILQTGFGSKKISTSLIYYCLYLDIVNNLPAITRGLSHQCCGCESDSLYMAASPTGSEKVFLQPEDDRVFPLDIAQFPPTIMMA